MNDGHTVERILQFKFRSPNIELSQLLAMIESARPFYQASGIKSSRLLRNVDDPGQFIQVVEYTVPEMMETNRQAIAGDAMIQGYLRAWRSVVPGAVEVDVFEEVK